MTYIKQKPQEENRDSIREKINLAYNIHRHIDRMSAIIVNPELSQNHYNWAIQHLLRMIKTYGDEEFLKKIKETEEKYDKRIKEAGTTQKEIEERIEKNLEIFEHLNELIKKLRMGLEQEGSEIVGTDGKNVQ